MPYTKEEYENLINNSPLFSVDKDKDFALYESERRILLRLIVEYYHNHVYKGKLLEEYSYALIETAAECIKYFRKDKGAFVNLLNHNMKRNYGIYKAKEAADRHRQGITIGAKNEALIRKIVAYAKSKGLDLHDLSVQEQVAKALNISVAEVDRLISVNDNAVAMASTGINDDGEEVELFDLLPSAQRTDENILNEDGVAGLFDRIENAYLSMQDRPVTKRLLSMIITAKVYSQLEDIGKESMLAGYTFCSEEIIDYAANCGEVPTLRYIAAKCGVSVQSASRTYKKFIEKIKNDLF